MGVPTEKEIRAVLSKNYDLAKSGIANGTIGLQKSVRFDERFSNSIEHITKSQVTGVRHLEHVAALSVDLRESSYITSANRIDDLFISIHCFLPMVAFLAVELEGEVLGLRGDGLIAAFGIGRNPKTCVANAVEAGMVMIEATSDILNPFLKFRDIPIQFTLGGGIDYGEVAFTKIGIESVAEVTGYGVPINTAAKNSGENRKLWISEKAMYAWLERQAPAINLSHTQNRIPRGF